MMQFWSYQTWADKFVLVHCTHGYNCTGHMIARFLVDTTFVLTINSSLHAYRSGTTILFHQLAYHSCRQLINLQEHARQNIQKLDYINDLYNFDQERKSQSLVCLQTPEWRKFSDQEDNGFTHLQACTVISSSEVILFWWYIREVYLICDRCKCCTSSYIFLVV